MIGIGTQLFDLDGDFVLYDISDDTSTNASRRISKVKTLDGGVFIDDSGYTAGDTDITVTVLNPSADEYNKLKNIFMYHSFVYISSKDGNFLCAPSSIELKSGNAVMNFSTKEAL